MNEKKDSKAFLAQLHTPRLSRHSGQIADIYLANLPRSKYSGALVYQAEVRECSQPEILSIISVASLSASERRSMIRLPRDRRAPSAL
jgi:hypothetical protein